jgi:hypothetical protein
VVLGLAVRPAGTVVRFDHPRTGPLPLRADLREQLAAAARRAADQQATIDELQRALAAQRRARTMLEEELHELRGR